MNQPAWHAAEVPGGNGITNAVSLSRLYAGLIGHGGGRAARAAPDARAGREGPHRPDLRRRTRSSRRSGFAARAEDRSRLLARPARRPSSAARAPSATAGPAAPTASPTPRTRLAVGYVMNKMSVGRPGDPRPHGDRHGRSTRPSGRRRNTSDLGSVVPGRERRGMHDMFTRKPRRPMHRTPSTRSPRPTRSGRTSSRRTATPCCAGPAPSPPGRASCSTSTARACSAAPAVAPSCSTPTPSSTRDRVGPASTGRSRPAPSSSGRDRSHWHGPDRDRVRPVRRPPRARVPRRADRHRDALLRQLALADLRARTRMRLRPSRSAASTRPARRTP